MKTKDPERRERGLFEARVAGIFLFNLSPSFSRKLGGGYLTRSRSRGGHMPKTSQRREHVEQPDNNIFLVEIGRAHV